MDTQTLSSVQAICEQLTYQCTQLTPRKHKLIKEELELLADSLCLDQFHTTADVIRSLVQLINTIVV